MDADIYRDSPHRPDAFLAKPILPETLVALVERCLPGLTSRPGAAICDRPIADVCPVEWARMENRSVLQWDKDDCAAIGLVKFDLLGLGMLSALHYCIDLVAEHKGIDVDLAKLDLSEHAVYEMAI